MTDTFDIAVIGAGMAGASIAAELAPYARVVLCEAEDYPGYHTTGRSAAFREECYGGPDIVPLTLASGDYLREGGFLTLRGGLYLARDGQDDELEAFRKRFADSGVTLHPLDRAALEQRLPGVRKEWTQALSQPNCADIDVAGLHQHYLSRAKAAGAQLRARHRLQGAQRVGDQWRLDFGAAGELRAGVVVNAAGAWADQVAALLGARQLGIQPLRRTVAQLRVDPAPQPELPLTLDETPSEPCDAAPEEYDVALALDRFQQVVDWKIEAVERKWAGLRSFSPDRLPL